MGELRKKLEIFYKIFSLIFSIIFIYIFIKNNFILSPTEMSILSSLDVRLDSINKFRLEFDSTLENSNNYKMFNFVLSILFLVKLISN